MQELAFDDEGLPAPGDYPMTFDNLRRSLLVRGPGGNAPWDADWRLELVRRAEILVQQLWTIGIGEIFLDGSFVEDKAHPNDIDGYFECDLWELASGELQRKLNLLDPYQVWTWDPRSRRAYRGYAKKQLPMWHVYRVELYPHTPGVLSRILDQNGVNLPFPAAFRRHRATGRQKGIIKTIR